jgi:hypothetical protein
VLAENTATSMIFTLEFEQVLPQKNYFMTDDVFFADSRKPDTADLLKTEPLESLLS